MKQLISRWCSDTDQTKQQQQLQKENKVESKLKIIVCVFIVEDN